MRKPFLLAFAAVTLSFAQKAPLSKEDQINAKLDQMQKTLDRISKILQEADAPPVPPPPIKVDVSKSLFLGNPRAPITIVEFTDMQCPYCNKFHADTWPQLHDKFVATGKVKFVSRDLPLPMHPHAHTAAEAGRCSGEQGHYWEMRDWMQSNPDLLDLDHLREHAAKIDLNVEKYRSCMTLARYADSVDADVKLAKSLNINGTPAFIIGKSGAVVQGELIMGAQSLDVFEKAIANVK